MTYRSDVDALAARTDALAAEVRLKTQELDSARSLLDEAKAKARLPVLPNIRVATPCNADWNAMTGDDRIRACASCSKNVYNLSTLTREEAEALILAKEGRLCVRYYQRKDGTILLKDCSIGITQRRKRRVLAAGIVALLGGGVFAAIRLNRPTPDKAAAVDVAASVDAPDQTVRPVVVEPQTEYQHIMGGMAPLPDLEVKMGDYAGPEPIEPVLSEGTLTPDGSIIRK